MIGINPDDECYHQCRHHLFHAKKKSRPQIKRAATWKASPSIRLRVREAEKAYGTGAAFPEADQILVLAESLVAFSPDNAVRTMTRTGQQPSARLTASAAGRHHHALLYGVNSESCRDGSAGQVPDGFDWICLQYVCTCAGSNIASRVIGRYSLHFTNTPIIYYSGSTRI